MIRKLTGFFIFMLLGVLVYSQDTTAVTTPPDENKPEAVRDFFNSSILIDNPTVVNPFKGAKQIIIQHRFATIKKIDDLYGIYGASNIRLAFNYGITDKLMVGFGTEKYSKLQEFSLKYNILEQKTKGTPIAVSYFVNTTIDARNKADFYAADDSNLKFTHRLTYFHQLIIARKINERISVMLSPSFSHINSVDSIYQNNAIGLTFGGRVKFYNEMSFIFEYNHPSYIKSRKNYQLKPQDNYAFGIELGTGTHCFQIFATSWDKLGPQQNMIFNQKKFKDLMLGFNITVRM